MKKIFFLISAFLIQQMSFGQDSTKLSVNKVYEDAKTGFYRLVSTLEGPAKDTYKIYVKQQLVTGWTDAILNLTLFAICLILLITALKRGKWEDGEPKNKWAVAQVAFSIIMGIILISICISASDIVSKITNPQYPAIQKIITNLK